MIPFDRDALWEDRGAGMAERTRGTPCGSLVLAEIRNGLEVRHEAAGDQLDIALAPRCVGSTERD